MMPRTATLALALVLLSLCPSCTQSSPLTEKTEKTEKTETPKKSEETETPKKSAAPANEGPVINHIVETLAGKRQDLGEFRGKTLLIVNTASECGFTPQYAKLQELYGRYKDRGLLVLGFPSNDFGGQEPGDASAIQNFVLSEYAVDFPMMAKVHTKGPEIAPLYQTLTQETDTKIRGEVQWNFTKFLIDPNGEVIARFESPIDPMSPEVIAAVESALPPPG